jgi:peptidoglycan/LPS O-acetylase OafA/YrhL
MTTLTLNRIPAVDGLRGVAILAVLSFHFVNNQLVNSVTANGRILAKVTSFGWAGVDLFFVLSGFLITSVLLKKKKSNNFFTAFFIRRIFRIIPCYYLLLAIFLLIQAVPYFSTNHLLVGNKAIPMFSYFSMVHNLYMAHANNLLSISWSIGIEEQFYIVFPFLIYWIDEKKIPFVLGILIVLASIARSHIDDWIPAYVLLPTRMDALSVGALVACFFRHEYFSQIMGKYKYHLVSLLIIDMCVCAYLYFKQGDLGPIRHGLFAAAFGISLLFALYPIPVYTNILCSRHLQWIGKISYSLYLFHYLILATFHHIAGNRAGLVLESKFDLAVTLMALSFSFIFAWALYNWLERPLVACGRTFVK